MSLLLIFGGLPGAGKTTIAKLAAERLAAVYLRIDSLEMALVRSGLVADQWDLGPAGYYAACAVAVDNLKNGMIVVADSVNPIQETRDLWRTAARQAGAAIVEVEVVCSDIQEHKRRVETRKTDVSGLRLPTWQQVMQRRYEPWETAHTIDTANLSPEAVVERVTTLAHAALAATPKDETL